MEKPNKRYIHCIVQIGAPASVLAELHAMIDKQLRDYPEEDIEVLILRPDAVMVARGLAYGIPIERYHKDYKREG